MWIAENGRSVGSDIAIMNEARAMRDEALARLVTAAWRGLANFCVRLLHVGHGHARTH